MQYIGRIKKFLRADYIPNVEINRGVIEIDY